jgi:hypothetical protein
MKKAQRYEVILQKAREYARSGQYSGWHEIEIQLRSKGWTEARSILDGETIRDELDRLCKASKAKSAKS